VWVRAPSPVPLLGGIGFEEGKRFDFFGYADYGPAESTRATSKFLRTFFMAPFFDFVGFTVAERGTCKGPLAQISARGAVSFGD